MMQSVTCPMCQTVNRVQANFCKQCGAVLMAACPRCGVELPESAHFCDHCGLRLVDAGDLHWWQKPGAASGVPPTPDEARQRRPGSGSGFAGSEAASSDIARIATSPPAPAVQVTPVPIAPAQIEPTPLTARTGDAQLQQYIPKELLTKLDEARSRGEMVGERRVVTMLFCDVFGSTAAAEQLDPEEWSEIMNGAFETMIRPVYQFEGTLARLMGDGLLAFFGAPIAHEDDALRAVLTGLDIVSGIRQYRNQVTQRFGIEIDVRVGINTGMVVVGAVGSDLRMEYTALGDAINLAARMEQTAVPGTVQIAHDTYKLVKSAFEFEELGSIEIKGKTEPVLVYRPLGRKSIAGRLRGIEGLHAELVGRQAEMGALNKVVLNLKQGVGGIVCLLGEAGIGKSRLVSETRQIFDAQLGAGGGWVETGSLSYETNQAYGLFQRLMRRVCGIVQDDPPELVRSRLAAIAGNLGESAYPEAKHLLETLFGLASENGGLLLEGEAFKQALLETMQAVLREQFGGKPSVLVFEDMHWSDAASVDLLRQLLPLTEDMPLVMLCVMRNERQAPAWQIRNLADDEYRHRYTELALGPLSEAESNELVNRLLANADLPDSLRLSIIEKAGGNPYFIEEVVRTLIDSGAVVSEIREINGVQTPYWRATSEGVDFDIPDNLQSLLAARIDRLEEPTRATLQIASVIGRTFFRRVLQSVDEASQELDKHLGTLLRLDMIREAARMPELEYAFRNPMTQEAVYNTILLKRRREFHRRVGEVMEALYAERLNVLSGLLAHHYALGNQAEKAIQYYRLAAQQAIAVYAYEDASHNLHQALDLIKSPEMSGLHSTLLEELGDVYRALREGERAIEHYRGALELLPGTAAEGDLVEVRLQRKIVQVVSEVKWSVGLDYLERVGAARQAARASLEGSLLHLESQPAQLETVRVLVTLSMDAWRMEDPPDWETAQGYAQQAVEMARQVGSPVDLSKALGALATVLDGRSLLRENLDITMQRLEICRGPQFDDLAEIIDAVHSAGAALMYVGEYEQAITYLEEAESLARNAQLVFQQTGALGILAQCLFRLDRWDEVLAIEGKWRDLEGRYTRERVGGT